MSTLSKFRELHAFLGRLSDADAEVDLATTDAWATSVSPDERMQVLDQGKAFLAASPEISLDEIGAEANRWFGDAPEAREWLEGLLLCIRRADASGGEIKTKDSNGAVLEEGDSVTVIKDLKVKGGSSDLKRGTIIRKIHLIGDPENIECRVEGSTLVLKTIFLRKA